MTISVKICGLKTPETVAAAVAGGVTSLACPPDTDPPLDEPGLVDMLRRRAQALALARVYPLGALTVKLEGRQAIEWNAAWLFGLTDGAADHGFRLQVEYEF